MNELRRDQEILMDLARELKRVCEKYNLRYFLHAGSLLGAVRHQGFIPWDDDMDFSMPREDFDKLKEIAKEEIRAPFFLQTEENTPEMCTFGRMRLRMDGTTGVQLIREMWDTFHQGICIDISPLDLLPADEKIKKYNSKKADLYAALHYLKHYGKKNQSLQRLGWKKMKTRFMYYVSLLLSDNYLLTKKKDFIYTGKDKHAEFCFISSEIFGEYRYLQQETWYYDSSTVAAFEQEEFPIPIGVKEILTLYYGQDFMTPPKEENRKGHHNQLQSTTQNYHDFLRPFHDIFKNTTDKEIVVFGAGQMLEHYLKHTKKKYCPKFVVDNDKKKWGKQVFGLNICAPEEIKKIPENRQYVIICSIYYKEIMEQLKQMGISNYYVYVQNMMWL